MKARNPASEGGEKPSKPTLSNSSLKHRDDVGGEEKDKKHLEA